ncbi:MAG: UPF0182 family protein [Actinobacteria bacterium]|nr:UPF0182 family protein [Actinomycetota bacterium]MCL6104533.1 UPF0182 family protein [Actinomycetota bacterium]
MRSSPGNFQSRRPNVQRIRPTGMSRRRIWIIVAIIVVLFGLIFLSNIAGFYTDYLWFGSVHQVGVWTGLIAAKFELGVIFILSFFIFLWVNLAVADKVSFKNALITPVDELVQRYQAFVTPRAKLIRTVVAAIFALLVGASAIGEWRQWILFTHATSFSATDPQFHRNIGYFVFKLPFESFVVNWTLAALALTAVVIGVIYYFNGGIRPQDQHERVTPAVKAHLSVILGLIALTKAGGYYLQGFSLDISRNGFVNGAGYTAVHYNLPALELLVWISLASGVILLLNIKRRGWVLPVIAVGLWAFVALVVGVIYPALIHRFKVLPAQDVLESPYISRNIAATRTAYGLNHIVNVPFSGSNSLNANTAGQYANTLAAARLWDPSLTNATFQKLQDIRSYYQFNTLAVDRYMVGGQLTPVVVGVRQIDSADLPQTSWVNVHLQYTHGYGAVVAQANAATPSGNPQLILKDVPPTSNSGFPTLTQPSAYYGTGSMPYAIVDTKQPEIDYQLKNGNNQESHYTGTGGVPVGSFINKAAFALRFSDVNILFSGLITSHSRMMFVRNIQARAEKAAPFLHFGSNPYPVILNGGIYWVQNAYTTTNWYPYSQEANTIALNPNSGLNEPFDYVRNSVKVVTNAYSGKMTFYVTDPHDPIIQAYEKAFPHLFTPASKMSAALLQHLRYPQDLFTVEASMYGRYHIVQAGNFYNAGDAWALSPAASTSPSGGPAFNTPTNSQGIPTGPSTPVPMSPVYQVMRLPGETNLSFDIIEPFVPVSASGRLQTLSGFLVAGSGPTNYGQLTAYFTPPDQSIDGPSLIDARIEQVASISQEISLLDSHGSVVNLGTVLMLPIHQSILYIRPLYVVSSGNALPELKEVIAVYGSQAAMGATLAQALAGVFNAPVPGLSSGTSTPPSSTTPTSLPPGNVTQLLVQAQSLYTQAQSALSGGNLGAYQADINQMDSLIVQANKLLTATTSTTTTTTTIPPNSA